MPDQGLSEEEQKRLATQLLLDAWDAACAQGVSPDLLAEVAIYLAVTDLVADQGEEWTAAVMADLPDRIAAGEFTLKDPAEGEPGEQA